MLLPQVLYFFATIPHGTKYGAKSGLIFSVAHTTVEFTLIMFFALGLLAIASEPIVKLVIGVAGGIVLTAFDIIQIYNSIKFNPGEAKKDQSSYRHLFPIGLAVTVCQERNKCCRIKMV